MTQGKTFERLLRLMSTRMTWDVCRRALLLAGIPPARGWAETIAATAGASYSEARFESAVAVLTNAYVRHTYVGNKHVNWYDFRKWNADWVKSMETWASGLDSGELNAQFELGAWKPAETKMEQADLEKRMGKAPKLVAVVRDAHRVYFQFSSVRTYSSREPLDLSTWSPEQRQPFEGYYELIGVRRQLVPCFDSLVIDVKAKRLEVRVDYMPGFGSDEQNAAYTGVVEQMNKLFLANLTFAPVGIGRVNYYPAVDKIYLDKSAGIVSMLSFVANSTATTSNNSGKTHRKQGQDLRDDDFHLGGKEKVNSIIPYSIAARFKSPTTQELLTLELIGSAKMAYGANATIETAHFAGCTTGEDYDLLATELSRQLP